MFQLSVTPRDVEAIAFSVKEFSLKHPLFVVGIVFIFLLAYYVVNRLGQEASLSAKDSRSDRKRRKAEALEALKEARKELSALHTNDFEIIKGDSKRYHSRMNELSRKLRIIDPNLGKDFLNLFEPTRLIKVAKDHYTKIGKTRDPKVIGYFESIKKDYRSQLDSVRDRIDKKLKKY